MNSVRSRNSAKVRSGKCGNRRRASASHGRSPVADFHCPNSNERHVPIEGVPDRREPGPVVENHRHVFRGPVLVELDSAEHRHQGASEAVLLVHPAGARDPSHHPLGRGGHTRGIQPFDRLRDERSPGLGEVDEDEVARDDHVVPERVNRPTAKRPPLRTPDAPRPAAES